eukprot:scaffold219459_cov46-Prasinocladus_malaysianus.AAC.2
MVCIPDTAGVWNWGLAIPAAEVLRKNPPLFAIEAPPSISDPGPGPATFHPGVACVLPCRDP